MDSVLAIVERSNQRGGRMLSLIDLIEAGTLDIRRAAWLVARIEGGASFLVGARPGGAGKTTVMSALLAMLPEGETIRLTNHGTGWEQSRPGRCVVSYEIGSGSYDAYVWGRNVVRLTELALSGVRVVSNLHADTLDEARKQIVDDCGASPEGFDALSTFVPVRVDRDGFSSKRTVAAIRYHENELWRELRENRQPRERETEIARFLHACRCEGVVEIAEVRRAWLEWLRQSPPQS